MHTAGSLRGWILRSLALLLLAGLPAAAHAEEAPDLRKKALALNEVTGEDPITAVIVGLLEDEEGSKKLLAQAQEMAKGKEQPFTVNATYILARTAHGLKMPEAAEKFYRLHIDQAEKLQSAEKLARAFTALIQMLYENKQFADSEKVCKEFLELSLTDPDANEGLERRRPIIMRQMILIIARQGEMDKALDMVERLIRAQPANWLNLDLKARVLREGGKLSDSASTYEELIGRIKRDARLTAEEQDAFVNEIRYSLSGVYVELKQIDKAAEHLKALLDKEPNNPTYNNDLGYIWADHDMNLDESERLIRKALEEDRKQRKANPMLRPEDDKDNPAYLDSLGWVLFKKKKYEDARKYLIQAVEQPEGRHVEIYDHLGDVHMMLGEKDKAIEAWRKGLQVATSSRRDQEHKAEVEKKLKAALEP